MIMSTRDVHKQLDTNKILNSTTKDILAAMAVHELKEPVHAVQSFLSVILQGRTGPLNDAQVDFLSTATQATRRIARRIEDFRLIFSDQLHFSLNCKDIDLFEHIQSCAQELRVLGELHDISLSVAAPLSRREDIRCWGDPDRIQQILLNLFENAIRYSPPNTTVNVIVREMKSGGCAIVVQNMCEPEAAVHAERWFDPFWRGESQYVDSPVGMGIGLTIVDHLVNAHGGVVQAFSKNQRVYIGLALPASNEDRLIASQLTVQSSANNAVPGRA